MESLKQKRSRAGKLGNIERFRLYREHLIDELIKCKSVDKGRLNFYQEYSKNDYTGKLLREALMVHRQMDKEN